MERILKTNKGEEKSPNEAVFPILTGNIKTKEFIFVATGFFINPYGGFITAKHVMFDDSEQPINPFFAIQTVKGKTYLRRLEHFVYHPLADIAIGMLSNDVIKKNKLIKVPIETIYFQLSKNAPNINDEIKTFAYPESTIKSDGKEQIGIFNGIWQNGIIEEFYPKGTGAFLKSPCYQTSVLIQGGASGGPVLHKGKVIGINSTGYKQLKEEKPLSFITPITEILEMSVIVGQNKRISVKELIAQGKILFN